MLFTTIYCIDGSGNKNVKNADRKRPIYELNVESGKIVRVVLEKGQTVADYITSVVNTLPTTASILLAADLPIGLPVEPKDVYQEINAGSFLEWLYITQTRLNTKGIAWRDDLIATASSMRTPQRPFVSIKKGDQIGEWAGKRKCDQVSKGETVYCVDHSAKQVGKAALQFWFEVLMPLKQVYGTSLAVWPFEKIENKRIVIAECYPAECQRMVFGTTKNKRNPLEVANSLIALTGDPDKNHDISLATWIQAASSEDEFDMFTTAIAFREIINKQIDLMNHPKVEQCTVFEGWMLGLVESSKSSDLVSRVKGIVGKPNSNTTQSKVPFGAKNRNQQEHVGLSGTTGKKGPMHALKCHRLGADGIACGHVYETNPQDVFHKRCPQCQGKSG